MKNLKKSMATASLKFNSIWLLLGVIFLTAFTTSQLHQRMDELTVKRINIIEDDGTIRMVISNKTRQHPGRMDGEDLPPRDRWAGLTFFNDEGDECGGLGYGVQKQNGVVSNGMIFTMDRYKHDQVIQMVNSEQIVDGKFTSQRGLGINDVDDESMLSDLIRMMNELESITDENLKTEKMMALQKLAPRNRLFIGKTQEGSHGLFIMSNEGRPLLMLYVDKEGSPKFQTMDENGNFIDLLSIK